MPNVQRLALRLLACAFTGFAGLAPAQDMPGAPETPPPPPVSLETLAGEADLVALVQVLDTDYETTRDFPTGGTAFLKVLIPYKVTRPLPDIVKVYEEGLHDNECYFPNPDVTEEGRRYLLFVRDNPEVEGQYLGMPQGCALTVLVTADNQYVLRYPLEGIDVTDDLSEVAKPVDYADSHAVLDYDELDVGERIDLLDRGLLVEGEDRTYKLTEGVPLGEIRRRLGEENLTTDRTLLRPAPADEDSS